MKSSRRRRRDEDLEGKGAARREDPVQRSLGFEDPHPIDLAGEPTSDEPLHDESYPARRRIRSRGGYLILDLVAGIVATDPERPVQALAVKPLFELFAELDRVFG